MKKNLYSLFVGCMLLMGGQKTMAQAAALDSTFSLDGKVTTSIGASDDFCRAIAIQADGKIVAAGYQNIGVLNDDFALIRYNADGSIDASFGVNGIVSTGIGSSDDKCNAVAIQADGKIVIAGSSAASGNSDCSILRFNVNGTQDMTFGLNGYVTIDLGSNSDCANSIAIQADGKIVIGGSCTGSGGNSDFALVRVDVSGSLDLTFGNGGIVKTDIALSQDFVYGLAIQTDGKIVACGTTVLIAGTEFAVVRYNVNGTVDASFGTNGMVTVAVGTSTDEAYSVCLQTDGKIVLGGYSNNGNDNDFAIVRLNVNGTLDTGFDTDGKVTLNIGVDDIARGVSVDINGKIVAGGISNNGTKTDFAVVRCNANGSLDNTLDLDGKVTIAFGINTDEAFCIAVQSDGKVVAGGASLNADFDFALARLKVGVTVSAVSEYYKNESGINAYYNPVSSELHVNGTSDKGEIILRDMTGKEVLRIKTVGDQTSFSTEFLAPGCYLLNYLNKDRMSNVKLAIF